MGSVCSFGPLGAPSDTPGMIRFQLAYDDCCDALRCNPGNTKALVRRGRVLVQMKRWSEVCSHNGRVFSPHNSIVFFVGAARFP